MRESQSYRIIESAGIENGLRMAKGNMPSLDPFFDTDPLLAPKSILSSRKLSWTTRSLHLLALFLAMRKMTISMMTMHG